MNFANQLLEYTTNQHNHRLSVQEASASNQIQCDIMSVATAIRSTKTASGGQQFRRDTGVVNVGLNG